jgi:hypothetical protein
MKWGKSNGWQELRIGNRDMLGLFLRAKPKTSLRPALPRRQRYILLAMTTWPSPESHRGAVARQPHRFGATTD